MYLGQIAEYIWDTELDDGTITIPAAIITEKQKIADYLAVNVGQLNVFINSEFDVADEVTTITPGTDGWASGGDTKLVTPELLQEESMILVQLFLRDHYKKKARTALNSVTSSSTGPTSGSVSDWTELREGDSTIKRIAQLASPAQKAQAARSYESLSSTAGQELSDLVQKYNLYLAKPRQVVAKDTSQDA